MGTRFKIGGLLLLLFLLIVMYGLYLFNLTDDVDVKDVQTDIHISAAQLLSSFETDERNLNDALVEKVIEVTGIVKEINTQNDRYTILLKGNEETFSCVLCDMKIDQIEKVQHIKPGQQIKLKGVFKGYLQDAILLNCILLNNNHQ